LNFAATLRPKKRFAVYCKVPALEVFKTHVLRICKYDKLKGMNVMKKVRSFLYVMLLISLLSMSSFAQDLSIKGSNTANLLAASNYAAPQSAKELIGVTWSFERADGTVLSTTMKLASDGRIVDGTGNWNESFWKFENKVLYIIGGDGTSVTTIFDRFAKADGKFTMIGSYAYDPSITHVMHQLTEGKPEGEKSNYAAPQSAKELIGITWSFERADGTVLSTTMKLASDGRIVDGTGNWNESFWKFEDGILYIIGGDGTSVTTIFDRFAKADGKLTMIGSYAYDPSITHVMHQLTESESEDGNTVIVPESENISETFESGNRLSWTSYANAIGYRLFRSTSSGVEGISVTDFYITSVSFADVNVESNTTYYYTVRPVLAEANPVKGIDEKLGSVIARFTIKTGNITYKPGTSKNFIMLQLDNPYLTKNGIKSEIDPGRGTTPVIISSRTMVPIRAIVEAMDGTVGWDPDTQKITLTARGNTVEMWIGKTDIYVNGIAKKMDVTPVVRNSRTFVPVRFAAENLNCKVDWINSTKEAVIVYEE